MLKLTEKVSISKLRIFILCLCIGILGLTTIILLGVNFTFQYGNFSISANNNHDAWVIYSKTVSMLGEILSYKDEKKDQQIRSTKDIVKKIYTKANSTFKQQMIDRGIPFSYDNPVYKSYAHMFYFVVDLETDDTVTRLINDLHTFVKEGHYNYEYYQIDFEKTIHTPVMNTVNNVRENVQKEWVNIADPETGIIITSAENYEYMESIAMEMYKYIQSVYIEAFKIELKYDKMINDKELELKTFQKLLSD